MMKTAVLLVLLEFAVGANLREFSFAIALSFLHYEMQISRLQRHFQAK
jgi:hypothetical protein